MKLSVVIVTWNSAADIEACIDSINFGGQFEVIVVDNASKDATRDRLAGHHHLNLVKNERNYGYARANNQGLKQASGEYVLLLNPDTRLSLGVLDRLSDWLDQHPETAAVAPRLVNPDGSTQLSMRSLPTAGSVLWELLGFALLFPDSRVFGRWRMKHFDYDRQAEVEQPMASCLMLRRKLLEDLGGFDESFPIFYNDVDLSKRMKDTELKTAYLPEAHVVHKRGASTSQIRPKMITASHRSLFRYLRKHDQSGLFWLKAIALLPLLEVSAALRILAWRLSTRRKP